MTLFQKVDPQKAKVAIIICSVLLIAGAGYTFFDKMFGAHERPDVFLKCSNSECNYSDMMTFKSFAQWAENQYKQYKTQNPQAVEKLINEVIEGKIARAIPLGNEPGLSEQQRKENQRDMAESLIVKAWGEQLPNLPARCPACGQYAVFQAQKCNNPDCGVIFFMFDKQGKFQITCPACGESIASREK